MRGRLICTIYSRIRTASHRVRVEQQCLVRQINPQGMGEFQLQVTEREQLREIIMEFGGEMSPLTLFGHRHIDTAQSI